MKVFTKILRHAQEDDGHALERLVKASVIAIANVDDIPAPAASQSWRGRLYVLTRTLGLKVIPSMRTGLEKRKVAILKDRRSAMIGALVHVVPVGVALAIISLNLTWWFPRGLPNISVQSITALQFAAKLHELTMVASLTTVVFSYISYELTSDGGLPFGAAFAGLRVQNVSYLWSAEFWGSLRSRSFGWILRLKLLVVVLLSSLLIATVGPSSATCMIPRRIYWPWQKSLFTVNATNAELFPTNLTNALYRNMSEPTYNYSTVPWGTFLKPVQWVDAPLNSGMFSIMSLHSVLVALSSRVADYGFVNSDAWMPSTLDVLAEDYLDPSDATRVSYALTLERRGLNEEGGFNKVATSIQVAGVTGLLGSFPSAVAAEMSGLMDAFSVVECLWPMSAFWNVTEPPPSINFSSAIQINLTADQYNNIAHGFDENQFSLGNPGTYFVELPDTNMSGFVSVTPAYRWPHHLQLAPCTIELGWFPTTVLLQANAASSKGPPEPSDSGVIPVKASREWLHSANSWFPAINCSALDLLLYNFDINDFLSPTIAVSALMTVTLARMSRVPIICGTFAHYGAGLNNGGTVCDDQVRGAGRGFATQIPVQYTLLGYGYGTKSPAVIISIVILMLYCVVALAHIVYLAWTGISSTAWNSVAETVALALASHPATELQNTCAGIETIKVFEHKVRIASTTGGPRNSAISTDAPTFEVLGDHLELLFPSTESHMVSKVAMNRAYGGLKEKLD